MRNIYKYIDKKYLFPIFLGRIVNSGLVLAQPLILTKALKLDQNGLSYGKILNFVLFGLSVYLVIYSLCCFQTIRTIYSEEKSTKVSVPFYLRKSY